jgi:predicted SAM-dependent methyltransferase
MRNCVICESESLSDIDNIENFPVFMGASEKKEKDYIFNNLSYHQCNKCMNLQISNLIPLDILYENNHNAEVVGDIWERHNVSFSKFIEKSKPKVVLEIGSPSATIYKKIEQKKWLEKWYSLEPNQIDQKYFGDKFELISAFIDKHFSFEKFSIKKPNAIVMSHVFEHLYSPSDILTALYNNLNIGDDIFISIPNMEYISNNDLMPPSGLHFEHTFYINLNNLKFLLNKNGFKIKKIETFENHSFFIKFSKINKKNNHILTKETINLNCKNVANFKLKLQESRKLIKQINKKIINKKNNVYIYGCHFPAQFFIKLGLEIKNIYACLDQSKTKIGKKLYGTTLEVLSPIDISKDKNPIIICHMGPYTQEIKTHLLKINKNTKFI